MRKDLHDILNNARVLIDRVELALDSGDYGGADAAADRAGKILGHQLKAAVRLAREQ